MYRRFLGLFCLLLIAVSLLFSSTAFALPSVLVETELDEGSKGDAVCELQILLKEMGLYRYTVDGSYGPATTYSVRLLQRQ